MRVPAERILIVLLGAIAVGGAFAAYTVLPHVATRVDKFLSPQSGGLDGFQANRNSTADLLLVGLVATAAVRECSLPAR